MAFKLTRQENNRRDEIVAELRSKYEILEKAINEDTPNPEQISTAAALFSVTLDEAESFREEIAERLREEFDEKSEKWQESEKGDDVNCFIDEWECADFSDPDINFAEPDITGLEDYADTLENLPSEI